MPNNRSSQKSTLKNKKKIFEEAYDSEELVNSDDDVEKIISSSDDESQTGGDSESIPDSEGELGSDSASLDIDPDDEEDPNEDDKYDPVNESEELEDPDDEDIEDEIDEGEEADEGDEGEVMEDDEGEAIVEKKTCHVKNLNKDFIVLDEDDSNMYGQMEYKKIADDDRESDSIMTYYEMVRIIGTRAQQFNFGAEPLVKGLEGLHPAKMAYLELVANMTPFIIRRHLPGKRYEDWRVDELEIIHTITDDFFVPEKFDWDALMQQSQGKNTSIIPIGKKSKENQSRISKTSSSKTSKTSGSKKTKTSGSKTSKTSGSKTTNSKTINKKK